MQEHSMLGRPQNSTSMGHRHGNRSSCNMYMRTSSQSMNSNESKTTNELAGFTYKDEDAVKLFVGQVPKHMNEDDLMPIFQEFGDIFDLAVIRDKISGLHRGCAFLTYCARASAEASILALHGQRTLQQGENPLQIRPAEGQAEQENKLFVGMVPRSANEDEIREVFRGFGTLREIHIIRDQDNVNKGCAFVKYTTRESALVAIETLHNRHKMHGGPRPLVVKFADNRRRVQEQMGLLGLGSPDTSCVGAQPEAGGWVGHSTAPLEGTYFQSSPSSPCSMSYIPYGSPYATMANSRRTSPCSSPSTPGYQPAAGSAGDLQFLGPLSPVGNDVSHSGKGHVSSSQELERDSRCHDGAVASEPVEGPPGANLFICHLPQGLSDADLATAFTPFGHVLSAKVYINETSGESKGFGFVSYSDPRDAQDAIVRMDGFQIGSKRLRVQHKRHGQIADNITYSGSDGGGGGTYYSGIEHQSLDYGGHQDTKGTYNYSSEGYLSNQLQTPPHVVNNEEPSLHAGEIRWWTQMHSQSFFDKECAGNSLWSPPQHHPTDCEPELWEQEYVCPVDWNDPLCTHQ